MSDRREIRCLCHRLLARSEEGKIVLRCPRCKREAVFSLGQREVVVRI
jgi:phage FluMu protein Com